MCQSNCATDLAIVTEDELRRYLRSASVLLAEPGTMAGSCETFHRLRKAQCWVAAVAVGLEQLLQQVERELAAQETLDEPLTRRTAPSRIEPPR